MVASNPDGVDMVEESNGKYAFFMESSSIEYLIERRCKLAQVIGVVFHIFFRLDFLGRPFKKPEETGIHLIMALHQRRIATLLAL